MKILKFEEKEIELEIEGEDYTLLGALRDALYEDEDVEVASYAKDHPYLGNMKLLVRTKNGRVIEALERAVKRVVDVSREFREKFRSSY